MSNTAFRIADAVSEHIVELSQTRLADMVSSYKTLERTNRELLYSTGIRNFFGSRDELEEFRRLVMLPAQSFSPRDREWGDFQTPPSLAERICNYLVETGVSPTVIIEPTCGTGNFIFAALKAFPAARLVYGVEIQEQHEWHLKIALLIKALLGHRVPAEIELHRDNIFTHRFTNSVSSVQDFLIIGNPPWVTNSELGSLGAGNLPKKQNIKALAGMDALTGKSNFDISEFILLRLLDLFAQRRGTLAVLCKDSTAKNIVEILPKRSFKVSNIRALEINAGREFGVAVDACLLVMDLGVSQQVATCQVATLERPDQTVGTFGWVGNKFVSSVKDYESSADLDGESQLVWRQGLKHDCSKIMELDASEDVLVNGNNQAIDIEEEFVYWLLKSSDLRTFEAHNPRKKVIVTQNRLGDDTSNLQAKAPKLWKYLVKNSEYFEKRKSSIYRGKPRFSIFGVGEYSFKAYKVAISGLYKEPFFSFVCPVDNRPVMLDDTCYFLGFDNYLDALLTATLLNGDSIKRFLRSVVFRDAKRPYTKQVLMRINIAQAASRISLQALCDFWATISYDPRIPITESDVRKYKQHLLRQNMEQAILL
jgi:hypothetical protein